MRLVIFIGMLLLCTTGWSQTPTPPFAPMEAQWTIQEYTLQPHATEGFPSFEVTIEKDTVIKGRSCRKMIITDADTMVKGSAIYIHTDDDQVFFFENGQFRLFMDFSLEEGDTLTHYIPLNQPLYAPDCCAAPDSTQAVQRVASATYDTIDGQVLRKLTFDNISAASDTTTQKWLLGTMRERLGGLESIFGRGLICCLAGYPGYTRCYIDDDLMYEGDTIGCGITSISGSLDRPNSLTVFPNPASAIVQVRSPVAMKATLLSIGGQVIKTFQLNKGDNLLPVKDIPNGVYIISARHGVKTYRQKLQVVH